MPLKVSARSSPKALAGAITASLRQQPQIEIHAVGPRAVNQAVKALAIARDYLAEYGADLIVQPAFAQATGGGVQMVLLATAIQRLT